MDPESLNKLATEHYRTGNLRMAVNALTTALKIDPDHVDSHLNVASLLLQAWQLDLARTHAERALALAPRRYESLLGMGLLSRARERSSEAIGYLSAAESVAPDRFEAPLAIGAAYQEMGLPVEAIAAFDRALRWNPSNTEALSNRLFAMNFLPSFDPVAWLAEHRAYERRVRVPRATAPRGSSRVDDGRLAIGYLSGDMRNHAVARFLLPVLRNHDHTRFHITGYHNGRLIDTVTRDIAGLCDAFRQVATVGDDALLRQIADDGIDVLIDLSGHSAGNRLPVFVARAAPVQATWMGYLGSTGISAMDLRFTDATADPEDMSEGWHSERIVRLPQTMWAYEPYPDAPDVGASAVSRNDFITFGVLSNPSKLSAAALSAWAAILKAVPSSRIRIMSRDDETVRTRTLQPFRDAGIDESRLALLLQMSTAQYLEAYAGVDIALDTFPVSGGTTVCDALWQGVPVLAVRSLRPYGATAASILHQVGHDDWIADSPSALVDKAVSLAQTLSKKPPTSASRAKLRDRMRASPLMDGAAVARAIESAATSSLAARRVQA